MGKDWHVAPIGEPAPKGKNGILHKMLTVLLKFFYSLIWIYSFNGKRSFSLCSESKGLAYYYYVIFGALGSACSLTSRQYLKGNFMSISFMNDD